MIRARFQVPGPDYRPVLWPIQHPYWCTGQVGAGDAFILVAYADDEEEIIRLWPDATGVDSEEADGYRFTSRFEKPDWFYTQEKK